MIYLEELSDDDLEILQKQFRRISEHYASISDHVAEVANVGETEEIKKPKDADDKRSS